MTQRRQVYRCYVCGNVVEVLTAGGGELHCCGVPMVLIAEKTSRGGLDAHMPVVEPEDNGVRVRVSADPHPMQSSHYIEWIEASCDGDVCRRYLRPEQPAEARFALSGEGLQVRVYCSKHGLWRGTPEETNTTD